MRSPLKELYDDLYRNDYHRDPTYTHATSFIEWICKNVPKGSKVLDVGCATGVAVKALQDSGYLVKGVDISSEAVSQGTARGVEGLITAPADGLPFEDGTFDVVLSTDVMEHLPVELVPKALKEMVRVSSPEASILLKIATRVESNKKYQEITLKHGYKNLHLTAESFEKWCTFFQVAGLSPVTGLKLKKSPKFFEVVLDKL